MISSIVHLENFYGKIKFYLETCDQQHTLQHGGLVLEEQFVAMKQIKTN